MQSSLWKTMAIVGVIGIGGLAIVKVQQGLGNQHAQSSPSLGDGVDATGSGIAAADTAANALLTPSEFDNSFGENQPGQFDLPEEPPLDSGDAAEAALLASTAAVNPQANTPPVNTQVSPSGISQGGNPFEDISSTTISANYQEDATSRAAAGNVTPTGFYQNATPSNANAAAAPQKLADAASETDQFMPFRGEDVEATANARQSTVTNQPFVGSETPVSAPDKTAQFFEAETDPAPDLPSQREETPASSNAPAFDLTEDSPSFNEAPIEPEFPAFPAAASELRSAPSQPTIEIPDSGELTNNPFREDPDSVPVPRDTVPVPSFSPDGFDSKRPAVDSPPIRRELPPRRNERLPAAEDVPLTTVPVFGADGEVTTPDSDRLPGRRRFAPSETSPFPLLPDADSDSPNRNRERFNENRLRFDDERSLEQDGNDFRSIPELNDESMRPGPSRLRDERSRFDGERDEETPLLKDESDIGTRGSRGRTRNFGPELPEDELSIDSGRTNRNLRDPVSDRQRSRPSRVRQVSAVMRPNLVLEKQAPENATVGAPLIYTIQVRNEGDATAYNVVIEDDVTTGAEVMEARPIAKFNRNTKKLKWEFDQIDPGESEEITVKVTPTGEGTLDGLATVNFKSRVRATTVITAPRLRLRMRAPEEVKLGEEVRYSYIISNEGTGEARDVFIRTVLPANGELRHPAGQDIEYEIESLKPNDQREIVLAVVAAEAGTFTTQAEVTASGGIKDQATVKTNVIGSLLTIVRRGPKRRFVLRSGVYENIVSNDTNFEAIDARVVEQVPEGMRFVSADKGGEFNRQTNAVTWNIDRLGANQSETLKIELMPTSAGTRESIVTVFENTGVSGEDYVSTTQVEDLHNVSADMNQLDGPVEVNEEFGFTITVDNRGTANATDVELVVRVPKEIQVIGAGSNEVQARLMEGNLVQYSQVINIEPDSQKDFDLKLKGIQPVRNGLVKASVRYKQMQEPLVISESVTIYDDQP